MGRLHGARGRLAALLLDTAAAGAEAKLAGESLAELVWTGPESVVSHSRDTAVVVRELFAAATRSVLVSTFTFVTSANFTEWAQQRNVEAGVLVRSAHFTRQLRAQFDMLVQSRAVIHLPGF